MKTTLALTLGVSLALNAATAAEGKVDFVKDIQPILQQNCIKCHGAEKQKGKLRLDTKTARVSYDGQAIKLTSHEYRLLAYLMHHRERVVSRTELVEHLYDQDFDRDSNTIEVFIGRLRKKIPGEVITTVRGLGYRLSTEADAT